MSQEESSCERDESRERLHLKLGPKSAGSEPGKSREYQADWYSYRDHLSELELELDREIHPQTHIPNCRVAIYSLEWETRWPSQ